MKYLNRRKCEHTGQSLNLARKWIAMNGNTFAAPWGRLLCWMSALSVLIIAGVIAAICYFDRSSQGRATIFLLPLVLFVTLLFIIRDYTVTPQELIIRRLLWATRVSLAGLQSAEFVPKAMCRSIRLCGNGGMFSFTGWYRSRALGNYRAFVTDLNNTVVLRFAKKTIVISPDNPERFVSEINSFAIQNS